MPGPVANFSSFDTGGAGDMMPLPFFGISNHEESDSGPHDNMPFMSIPVSSPPANTFGMNLHDGDGKTPLHQAVIGKNAEQVKTLLFSGAAVNIVDHAGNTPLHYGVIADEIDISIIKLLLRFGADVNVKGQSARSPLHFAVSNAEVVNVLISEGADPGSQDDKGDTPLHLALTVVSSDKDLVIDALLEAGSNPDQENNSGMTPFLKLLDRPYMPSGILVYVPVFLGRGASATKQTPDGRSPLEIFLSRVRSDSLWALKILRDYRNPNEPYVEAVKSLLDRGASVEATTSSGEPLAIAFFRQVRTRYSIRQDDLGEKICELSSPQKVFSNGNTLLHELAASLVDSTTLSWIEVTLRKGADPNRKNNDGKTPLMSLLFVGNGSHQDVERGLKIMLAHGANPLRLDSRSQPICFHAAEKYGGNLSGIVRRLLEVSSTRIRTGESLSTATGGQAQNNELTWWAEWEQAARADDWATVATFMAKHFDRHYPNVNRKLVSVAYSVLAERHLKAYQEQFALTLDQSKKDDLRKCVVEVLLVVREREFHVSMEYFDLLLALC